MSTLSFSDLQQEKKKELLYEFMSDMWDRKDHKCTDCGQFRMCANLEGRFYCLDCYIAHVYEEEAE